MSGPFRNCSPRVCTQCLNFSYGFPYILAHQGGVQGADERTLPTPNSHNTRAKTSLRRKTFEYCSKVQQIVNCTVSRKPHRHTNFPRRVPKPKRSGTAPSWRPQRHISFPRRVPKPQHLGTAPSRKPPAPAKFPQKGPKVTNLGNGARQEAPNAK